MSEIERDFGTVNTPPPQRWENVALVLQLFGYAAAEAERVARPEAHWDFNLASNLSQAIFNSAFAVGIDWRYNLDEMLEAYSRMVAPLGIRMTVEAGDGNVATVRCDGRGAQRHARVTGEPLRPDRVAAQLHLLMPADVSFRRSRVYEDGDTLCEAVLPNDRWKEIRLQFGAFFDEVFVPPDREPPGLVGGL